MSTFKREPLNKTKYSVRASQAVLQYGVGAMVEFEDQTLMTADSLYWAPENRKKIRDERLEDLHEVDFFYTPCVKNGNGKNEGFGIAYVRFPEWYFCPNCRKFKKISDWIDYNNNKSKNPKLFEDDRNMIKTLKCGDCNTDLVVARVVTACKNGHINDFPWVEWAHSQNFKGAKDICGNPDMEYSIAKTASAGLESVVIKCLNCGCAASLKRAFDFSGEKGSVFQRIDRDTGFKYKLGCAGRHPWKHFHEHCDCYPKAMQRGASSIYFPVTDSSIIIPPYSSFVRKKILDSEAFSDFEKEVNNTRNMNLPDENMKKTVVEAVLKGLPQKYCDAIHNETGVSEDKILKLLNEQLIEKEDNGHSEGTTYSDNYRYEEYLALTGVEKPEDEFDDFQCELMNMADYSDIPFISKISLISKMREVQAHIGFSRIDPTDPTESVENQPTIVSVKAETNGVSWLPACEVKGEGIFIELNEDYIQQWLIGNLTVKNKVNVLNQRYRDSYLGKNNKRYITPKFLLLHTLSHLLIKKLSFECGYNISSLKERIYCSEGTPNGGKMSGILIYTASGDSEGTLGGLVRQGRSDVFPEIVKKAIDSSYFCSNDPVCSLSQGQGHESLNYASCYACSLLPETSCEEFNIFLDRSVLTGTIDNRKYGFFNMFTMFSDETDSASSSDNEKNANTVGANGYHADSSDLVIALNKIKKDIADSRIANVLDKIIEFVEGQRYNYESPVIDNNLSLTDRDVWPDLMWTRSKVAWFLPERENDYLELKNSDWHCYLINADSKPEDLLKLVMEV